MIDSHIHLDDTRFDDNRAELIAAAQEAGIERFVVPAVQSKGFQKLKTLTQQFDCISPAYGLHPYWIAEHTLADLDDLDQWLNEHKAVAVGECGLDFYLKDLDQHKQRVFFEQQIELAKQHQLPLILHVRGAVQAVFELLKKHDYFKAVMHSFSGSLEQAKHITEKGVYLGFGGAITYERAHKLRAVVAEIPLQHLMIETDAPDQPVSAHRGELNLPEYLVDVVSVMAELKSASTSEVIESTRNNCKQLFGL